MRGEGQSRERELEFFRRDICRVFDPICERLPRQACKAFAVWIIGVQDRGLRRSSTGAFKQTALGGEIILKSFVKVHVLARQVGKNGRLKAAAPETIHHERV